MSIRREDVHRMAGLARLRLDDAQAEALRRDLERILQHVERLHTLDAGSHSPAPAGGAPSVGGALSPAAEAAGPAAPDALERPPEASAPRWEAGFFVVPPPRGVSPEGA